MSEIKLGDKVEYTAVLLKISDTGKVSRVVSKLPKPEKGVVVGRRVFPIGTVEYDGFGGRGIPVFFHEGTVTGYLVCQALHKKPVSVPVDALEVKDER